MISGTGSRKRRFRILNKVGVKFQLAVVKIRKRFCFLFKQTEVINIRLNEGYKIKAVDVRLKVRL